MTNCRYTVVKIEVGQFGIFPKPYVLKIVYISATSPRLSLSPSYLKLLE